MYRPVRREITELDTLTAIRDAFSKPEIFSTSSYKERLVDVGGEYGHVVLAHKTKMVSLTMVHRFLLGFDDQER